MGRLGLPVEGERGIILHGNHKYSSPSFIFKTLPHSYVHNCPAFDQVPSILRQSKINVSDTDHMVVSFSMKKDMKLNVLLQLIPSELCPES